MYWLSLDASDEIRGAPAVSEAGEAGGSSAESVVPGMFLCEVWV